MAPHAQPCSLDVQTECCSPIRDSALQAPQRSPGTRLSAHPHRLLFLENAMHIPGLVLLSELLPLMACLSPNFRV